MTALLELKQKIKNLYGQYELYLLPVFKFVLAMLYFTWINENMGYMSRLNSMFVVLILALICSILPSVVTVYAGFILMILHSYALSLETAGFMLVLILVMVIFFLRFSGGQNTVMAFTPITFMFNVPAILPIGSGLMGNAVSAIPAGCSVVLFYFIRFIKRQSASLMNTDLEVADKLQLLADGLAQNWGMWITVVAFVLVVLVVYLIRTRAFDYAWRIAIVAGGVTYVLVMLGGSLFLNATVSMPALITCAVLSVVFAIILEFFVFGGDYSRTERLEYEDDEYFYYVKAVPKASVSTSERSIKKINGEPIREERRSEEKKAVSFTEPTQAVSDKPKKRRTAPAPTPRKAKPISKEDDMDEIDFEKKLEESLKDL